MQILRFCLTSIINVVKFINSYFKTFVFLFIVLWIFLSNSDSSGSLNSLANLERIDLKGEITDVSKVLEKIIDAKNNTNINGT